MKKLRYIIFAIMILIIIISIFLFVKTRNKETEEDDNGYEEEMEEYYENLTIETVKDSTDFYTVKDTIMTYLDYSYVDYEKQGEAYSKTDEEGEEYEIEETTLAESLEISNLDEKKEALIKFLDFNYIKENNITVDNLEEYINIDNDEIDDVEIINMNVLKGEYFEQYSIYTKYTTESSKNYKEYYVVTLDLENFTFMVRPVKNCENIDDIKLNKSSNLNEIPDNEINEFEYVVIDDSGMTQRYYGAFKQLMLNNPEEAYNKLSEEYRNKRFGNLENFEKYINDNRDKIEETYASKFLVNDYDDYKEYICQDTVQNYLIFKATSVCEYEVTMDTYTITSDKFKEEYDKGTDLDKAKMSVDKFRLMINNKDYSSAYELLNKTFRQNNYPNEEDFINFIKSNMFEYNSLEFTNVEAVANSCRCKVRFKNLLETEGNNSPEYYEWEFIVVPKDNYEFEYSFSI